MPHINQFNHLKIQLQAILLATNNFSDEHYIGRGGFGKVYKGEVVHSKGKTMVALKRLDRRFGQGEPEFWKEIMLLSFYNHENIVSLLGYCDDHGEKILVYEYASNKSLDSFLASDDLTWVQRLKICVGAARGLAYLHTPDETQLRILHRDIKSSNILLDNNLNAKISDFGLSKFAPANNQFTFLVSNPVGTFGYIDPLYNETGLLTKESDVYSFGVVLFEVLCGRLCYGNENIRPLIGLVREYYEQNKISELIHSNIYDEINISSLKLFVDIAYQCLETKREERPLMTQIVSALESALNIQENVDGKAVIHGTGILNVKVLRTTDVGSKNRFEGPNYYLILDIGPSLDRQAKNVEWNEVCTLYVKNFHAQIVSIFVNKVESENKHCNMGEAQMKLTDLTPEIPLTYNIEVRDEINYQYIGDLKVEVLYKPLACYRSPTISRSVQKAPLGTPKDGGLLVVIIREASLRDIKRINTSVTLRFRGQLWKTRSMLNTRHPRWLQEFTFMLQQPPTDANLHLEVNDDSWMGKVPGLGSIGSTDISLADVVNKKRTYQLRHIIPGYLAIGNDLILLDVELQWRTSN